MEAVMQDIFLTIPESDMSFLQQFIASRPHDVPLTEEDILNELKEVRYPL